MPKSKSIYICSECGFESMKWYGKMSRLWGMEYYERGIQRSGKKHTASVLRPGESGRLKAAPF